MIFNLMDLTPEVNALVYGWRASSFEFDSLTLLLGCRFHDGHRRSSWAICSPRISRKSPAIRFPSLATKFTVVGIYRGGSALEAGAVIMPLDQLQKRRRHGGKSHRVSCQAAPRARR